MPFFSKVFGSKNERELKRMGKIVERVNTFEETFEKLTDDAILNKKLEFREHLESGVTLEDILPEAFAIVREAGKRTLQMRLFDVQLVGGITLHEGRIAEMRTGEGKTLVATLALYLNALTSRGVHLVTVNDYLAKWGRQWMGPLYEALGMTVGVVYAGQSLEEKKSAYQADITYGTNNEFGFDYLRDNMAFSLEEKVQRELNYSIVDEVDSILIYAPAFMPFSTDDMQPACPDYQFMIFLPFSSDVTYFCLIRLIKLGYFRLPASTQDNICTPARHVCSDSQCAWPSGLGNNFRFLLMKLGVQHAVFYFLFIQ